MFYTKDMPWRLLQNLTGIKEEYRGKGLGKWLKSDMLKFVKENEELNGVKYIVTQNATRPCFPSISVWDSKNTNHLIIIYLN